MECRGSELSGVLEDEMYMASLTQMSSSIACAVRDFPIDKWPLTLALSWGVSYPFHRFPNATSWMKREGLLGDIARRLKYTDQVCVLMHPSRYSVMVFAMDEDSTLALKSNALPELDSTAWVPRVQLVAEFATAALSDTTIVLSDMDVIQQTIFGMGFGPIPFYRRSSVATVHLEEVTDGEEVHITQRVACVMPHRPGGNGCQHSTHSGACYFCPYNPFCEVLFDSTRPIVRYSSTHVSELVMPGTVSLYCIP